MPTSNSSSPDISIQQQQASMKAKHQSTASLGVTLPVVKGGQLNKKTLITSSPVSPQQKKVHEWRPFKAILRGTKLYFYNQSQQRGSQPLQSAKITEDTTQEDIEKLWKGQFSSTTTQEHQSTSLGTTRKRKHRTITTSHPDLILETVGETSFIAAFSMDALLHEFMFSTLSQKAQVKAEDLAGLVTVFLVKDSRNCVEELVRLVGMAQDDSQYALRSCRKLLDLINGLVSVWYKIDICEVSLLKAMHDILAAVFPKAGSDQPSIQTLIEAIQAFSEKTEQYFDQTFENVPSEDVQLSTIGDQVTPSSFPVSVLLRVDASTFAYELFQFHSRQMASLEVQQLYDVCNELVSAQLQDDAAQLSWSLTYMLCPQQVKLIDTSDKNKHMVLFNAQSLVHPLAHTIHYQLLVQQRSASPQKRAQVVVKWILIAQSCLSDYGDLYGWTAIASAILSWPIARLLDTWKYVDLEQFELVKKWVPFFVHNEHPMVTQKLPYIAEKLEEGLSIFPTQKSVTDQEYEQRGLYVLEKFGAVRQILGQFRRVFVNVQSVKCSGIKHFIEGIYKLNPSYSKVNVQWNSNALLQAVMVESAEAKDQVGAAFFSLRTQLNEQSVICEGLHHYPQQLATKQSMQSPQAVSAAPSILQINDPLQFMSLFSSKINAIPGQGIKKQTSGFGLGKVDSLNSVNKDSELKDKTFVDIECAEINDRMLTDVNFETVLAIKTVFTQEEVRGQKVFYMKAATQERLLDLLVFGMEASAIEFKQPIQLAFGVEQYALFDGVFRSGFMNSFRSFMSAQNLLEGLRRRWNLSEKQANGSQVREVITELMQDWLHSGFEDFLDDFVLLETVNRTLYSFLASLKTIEQSNMLLSRIEDLVNSVSVQSVFYERAYYVPQVSSINDGVRLDMDKFQVDDVVNSLSSLACQLYQRVTVNDWISLVDLFENSFNNLSVSNHTIINQMKLIQQASSLEDYSLNDGSLFTCLQFLQLPSPAPPTVIQAQKSATVVTVRDRANQNEASQNLQPESQYSNTVTPFVTFIPGTIQSLINFQQNLQAWVIHEVINSQSTRHRLIKIKVFLQVAKACRTLIGSGNIVSKSIVYGLISQECRMFVKSWSVLNDMPLDGLDVNKKKDSMDTVLRSETYTELLEALFEDSCQLEAGSALLHQALKTDNKSQITSLPPMDQVLEAIVITTVQETDLYYVSSDQKRTRLLPKAGVTAASVVAQKGISANHGLPLVNIEKHLAAYQLCNVLSSFGKKLTGGNEAFGILAVSGSVYSSSLYISDVGSVLDAVTRDSEKIKIKLKFFTKITEQEKDLRKLREKEYKRMESLVEKDIERASKIRPVSQMMLSPKPGAVERKSSPRLNALLRLGSKKQKDFDSIDPSKTGLTLPRPGSAQGVGIGSMPHVAITTQSNRSLPVLSLSSLDAASKISDDLYKDIAVSSDVGSSSAGASTNLQKLPSYSTVPTHESVSHIDTSFRDSNVKPSAVVSLVNSRSHAASDYKRPFVFRVLTQDDQEILLQSHSKDDMLDWINQLNEVSMESMRKLHDEAARRASRQPVSAVKEVSTPLQEKKSLKLKRKQFDEKKKKSADEYVGPRVFRQNLSTMLYREMKDKYMSKQGSNSQSNTATFFSFLSRKKDKSPLEMSENSSLDKQTLPVTEADVVWDETNSIPVIMEKCLAVIEERGLTEIGIYRLSGTNTVIKELKQAFDYDPYSVDLYSDEYTDINVITGVFKMFLREMPNPLMTYELFDQFMEAASLTEYDDRLLAIKALVHKLPRPNFFMLKRLMQHLELVTDFEETNHMYASNLAIVIGPNILRPPTASWYAQQTVSTQNLPNVVKQTEDGSIDGVVSISSKQMQPQVEESSEQINSSLNELDDSSQNIAVTMKHLGKCTTVVKNMILQSTWLFDPEEVVPVVDEEIPPMPVTKGPRPLTVQMLNVRQYSESPGAVGRIVDGYLTSATDPEIDASGILTKRNTNQFRFSDQTQINPSSVSASQDSLQQSTEGLTE